MSDVLTRCKYLIPVLSIYSNKVVKSKLELPHLCQEHFYRIYEMIPTPTIYPILLMKYEIFFILYLSIG